MEIEKKIEHAQNLNILVDQIKEFIKLAEKAQLVDDANAKINEFHGKNKFSELHISTYICTGSQSLSYKKYITDNEVIKNFINAGLDSLKLALKQKEEELNNLFK